MIETLVGEIVNLLYIVDARIEQNHIFSEVKFSFYWKIFFLFDKTCTSVNSIWCFKRRKLNDGWEIYKKNLFKL